MINIAMETIQERGKTKLGDKTILDSLSFILDTNPFLFSIIQILGALFLIWIGFSTVMASLKEKRESVLQKESDVQNKAILISNL